MKENNPKKNVIVISGITASGKTNMALQLAKIYETEIISVDSRQVYKELIIGSDRPPIRYLCDVKHHMIGVISILENFSVGIFFKRIIQLVNNLFKKYNTIILVGGSGLYIDRLIYGIKDLPEKNGYIRDYFIKQYKKYGIYYLQNMLSNIDYKYFCYTDINNYVRIIRALEVYFITGKPYSYFISKNNIPGLIDKYNIIQIAIDINKDMLYNNISNRVNKMINTGLIDEAKKLYKYKNLYALNTIGYKEIFDFIDNKISLETAINKIKHNTYILAKKQNKWLKKYKNVIYVKSDIKILNLKNTIFNFIKNGN
ncbi:MAG: tRNA (adenosine(37)-N6)-dimethylallyltransferase MiaA [Bacteroides sp.]|nr:MAG: tRNA (adenosine(37)-N6)-dimethylallyltransferase MiaA [Bacteroides sp.]